MCFHLVFSVVPMAIGPPMLIVWFLAFLISLKYNRYHYVQLFLLLLVTCFMYFQVRIEWFRIYVYGLLLIFPLCCTPHRRVVKIRK